MTEESGETLRMYLAMAVGAIAAAVAWLVVPGVAPVKWPLTPWISVGLLVSIIGLITISVAGEATAQEPRRGKAVLKAVLVLLATSAFCGGLCGITELTRRQLGDATTIKIIGLPVVIWLGGLSVPAFMQVLRTIEGRD